MVAPSHNPPHQDVLLLEAKVTLANLDAEIDEPVEAPPDDQPVNVN